jgi:hypothetical protein
VNLKEDKSMNTLKSLVKLAQRLAALGKKDTETVATLVKGLARGGRGRRGRPRRSKAGRGPGRPRKAREAATLKRIPTSRPPNPHARSSESPRPVRRPIPESLARPGDSDDEE